MADDKQKEGQFLPGIKPVLELLVSSPERIDQVFVRKGRHGGDSGKILDLCRERGVRFTLVPDDALERLLRHDKHQGVAARLREARSVDWRDMLDRIAEAPLPLLLALDQVQDPGNLGALARTLYALGGAGIVVPRHNSAFIGAGARRSAAGALEFLPVAEVVNLSRAVEEAAEAGLATYAARAGENSLNALDCRLSTPALLVLGNEDKGVRPGVAKRCEFSLGIPFLRPFDSLNVAQAGGILISCFLRESSLGSTGTHGE